MQYLEVLHFLRPPSLSSNLVHFMRNKRSFHIKVCFWQPGICLTAEEGNQQSCHPFHPPLWLVSTLSVELILLVFGNQLPSMVTCIRIMAKYPLQPMKCGWLGCNMWNWIKKALCRNFVKYQKITPVAYELKGPEIWTIWKKREPASSPGPVSFLLSSLLKFFHPHTSNHLLFHPPSDYSLKLL